eukprot:1148127-Pelagomonas_calceolata.AAC.2
MLLSRDMECMPRKDWAIWKVCAIERDIQLVVAPAETCNCKRTDDEPAIWHLCAVEVQSAWKPWITTVNARLTLPVLHQALAVWQVQA